MKIKYLIFLVLIFLFLSCSKKSPETYKPLLFNVDSLFLDSQYFDDEFHFAFNPPKDWKPVSEELFKKIQNNIFLNSDSTIFKIMPKKIFMDSQKAAFCIISKFENVASSESLKNKYINLLKEKFQKDKISLAKFEYHTFKFDQLLIMNKERIIIKLIITMENNKMLILDYIIPAELYQENLRAIESSIGSLNLLKEEEK